MRAGRLSRRVMIQQRVESRTPAGNVVWTWQDFCPAWAEIAGIAGREGQTNAQVQATITHAITIRYVPGVVAKMRVVEIGCPDVAYDIEAPLANARRTELRLLCITRDADGWRG